MSDEAKQPQIDPAELDDRLRGLRKRFDEFRGRL